MQLPNLDGWYMNLVLFGTYTQGRLIAAGLGDIAPEVGAQNAALLAAGRALEDARIAEALIRAERDARDNELDDTAEDGRLVLASASKNAMKEAPYNEIHHEGIAHYTDAPIDEQEPRYNDLAQRYERFLPAGHPVRAQAQKIREQVEAWLSAKRKVDGARGDIGLARTSYDSQVERWAETLERVYGRLVDRFRRRGAERYFQRQRRGRDASDADATTTPEDGAPPA